MSFADDLKKNEAKYRQLEKKPKVKIPRNISYLTYVPLSIRVAARKLELGKVKRKGVRHPGRHWKHLHRGRRFSMLHRLFKRRGRRRR
jgi:hypothetical protein